MSQAGCGPADAVESISIMVFKRCFVNSEVIKCLHSSSIYMCVCEKHMKIILKNPYHRMKLNKEPKTISFEDQALNYQLVQEE